MMEKELRIIISGGGTGGHIFPAVSIANAIIELRPDAEILFVGAEGRMEMQRVPDAGYQIIGLPIAGFDRKHLWKNVSVIIKLIRSQWKARSIIKNFRPQVAVGVGDAAAGGAESTALLGKAVFFQPILHLVPRHRNGGLIGELQILGADFHTTGFDGLHLVCEVLEVNHHAGAQHTGHVRVQDAGGQQVQDELALLGDDGVSSIVAALIAGNDVSMFGQQVDDAALALIAPVDSSNSGKHNSLFTFFFVVYNGLHLGGQAVDADETGGIALLVVAACGKGGDVLTIQRVRRPDPCIDEVALVQFQTHLAGDMLLRRGDKGAQGLAQGAEPLAIVDQLTKGDG